MSPVSPRTHPRQARSRFTVDAILEATERLLSRAEKVSTRGIAHLAGVSVGTLYQYFPAKEAAVAAVIDKRLADDEERLHRVFARMRGQPLEDAVREVIEAFVPESEWERALYPKLVDTLESVERLRPVQDVLARFEALLAREFESRRGEIDPDLAPAEAATVVLHSQRAALFALARSHPELPRATVIEHLLRLGMRYLTPRQAGGASS
jgi:AcrR family transcriptional regulator